MEKSSLQRVSVADQRCSPLSMLRRSQQLLRGRVRRR